MIKPIVLSIAGSDPSSGAGIQADLRMFSAQNVFGTTVITALTAQNPNEVTGVHGMSPTFVQLQLDSIFKLPVKAIKTGMLWSSDIVDIVADTLKKNPDIPSVVDPVMISTSGSQLISDEAIERYKNLIQYCTLLTPNLDEASVLLEKKINEENLSKAAQELYHKFGCAILLKGGHKSGNPEDILFDGAHLYHWKQTRIQDINTHGTGCMLSASIAAHLARGIGLYHAVDRGLRSVQKALRSPIILTTSISLAGIEDCSEEPLPKY